MGHHICHVPELDVLIKQYDKLGLEKFVEKYKKCEGFIGDSESIRYIHRMFKLLNEISTK